MPNLKLFVFGALGLERNGRPIGLHLRKALGLLVYVAVIARPRAGMLWQH